MHGRSKRQWSSLSKKQLLRSAFWHVSSQRGVDEENPTQAQPTIEFDYTMVRDEAPRDAAPQDTAPQDTIPQDEALQVSTRLNTSPTPSKGSTSTIMHLKSPPPLRIRIESIWLQLSRFVTHNKTDAHEQRTSEPKAQQERMLPHRFGLLSMHAQ